MRLIDADTLRDEWLGAIGEYTANEILNSIDDIPTVPQEMSAREFFPTMARMCEYYNEIECNGCPLNHKKYEDLCTFLCFNHDDSEVANIVLAWAREHFERSEE